MRRLRLAFCILPALCGLLTARGASANDTPAAATASPAPPAGLPSSWMFMPVVSSSPKLGTAGGGLGAYLHKFDPASRVSILGMQAIYTTTDSLVASAFARTSFGGANAFVGVAGLYGDMDQQASDRTTFPPRGWGCSSS